MVTSSLSGKSATSDGGCHRHVPCILGSVEESATAFEAVYWLDTSSLNSASGQVTSPLLIGTQSRGNVLVTS